VADVVSKLWGWAAELAARASVDWRVVVAKVGDIGLAELDAWKARLTEWTAEQPPSAPKTHVTVASAQLSAPPTIIASSRPKASPAASATHPPNAFIYDTAWTGYAFLPRPGTSALPPVVPPTFDIQARVLADSAPVDLSIAPLRPVASGALVYNNIEYRVWQVHFMHLHGLLARGSDVHFEEVFRNLNDLAVLAQVRASLGVVGGIEDDMLPPHVAAVAATERLLARGELALDGLSTPP